MLRRGMKKRKGDPNAVRVLTEGERAEIARLREAVDAEERAREERRVAKAGPRPECLDEKPVSKREVESAVQAEASGGRAFTKAVKLLARRNALLEAQLAALKEWKRRGGDLNGHDERALLRLDKWRSGLTIARNRAVITRRRREVAAGMAHAVRHHATNPNRPRVGETCRRCQSQPASAPSTAAPTAPRTGAKTPRRRSTFLPHRYGSISTHLILDWEPSWMQSRRRIKGKSVDGGGVGGGVGGGGRRDRRSRREGRSVRRVQARPGLGGHVRHEVRQGVLHSLARRDRALDAAAGAERKGAAAVRRVQSRGDHAEALRHRAGRAGMRSKGSSRGGRSRGRRSRRSGEAEEDERGVDVATGHGDERRDGASRRAVLAASRMLSFCAIPSSTVVCHLVCHPLATGRWVT